MAYRAEDSMANRATTEQTPLRPPESLYLTEPIILGTSKRAYFRWLATVIIASFAMAYAYLMYSFLPAQVDVQLVLSLMAGVEAWALARLGELLSRRVEIDFSGLRLHTLFTDERVDWDQIKRIEWWKRKDVSARYTNYRIHSGEGQIIAAFSDDAWTHLSEGIGYVATAARLTPVRIKPPIPEIARVAVMILMPLAVMLFTVDRSEAWRIIGFVFVRIFYTVLVLHYTSYEMRLARFYMLLLSLTAIAVFTLIAGTTFLQTIMLLLYTPLLEMAGSTLVFRLRRHLQKRHNEKSIRGKI